jgi:hypothetical protein
VLLFDLVRFGQTGSAATIDHLQLTTHSASSTSAPLEVTTASAGTAQKNQEFTSPGSFHDPNGADNWTAQVDYGDGTGLVPLALNGTNFTLDHVFKAAGTFTVTVTVSEGPGTAAQGSASFEVVVANAAPVIGTLPGLTANPGVPVTFATTATDANGDTLTAQIDWGDGHVDSNVPVDRVTGAITGSHTYADLGSYTPVLSVSDGTDTTHSSFGIAVTQDATTASISGPDTIAEGAAYLLNLAATGPGAAAIQQWTINWGDGSIQTLTGNPSIAVHIFDKSASGLTISAIASDGGSNFSANTQSVVVTNVAPQLTSLTSNGPVNEGTPVRVSGTFTDKGQGDAHQAFINWGDGTTNSVSLNAGTNGFSFAHTYAQPAPGNAPYTVSVRLVDDSGATVTGSLKVAVLNAVPTASANGPASGLVDRTLQFSGAASSTGPAGAVQVKWDFGDGTVLAFGPSGNAGNLDPSHAYSSPGTYYITLTAQNAEGATATSIIPIVIDGVAQPSSMPGPTSLVETSAVAGGSMPGVLSFAPVEFDFAFDHNFEAFLYVDESETGGQPMPGNPLSWQFGDIAIPDAGFSAWTDSLYAFVERVYASSGAPLRVEDLSIGSHDGSLVITVRFSEDVSAGLSADALEIAIDGTVVDTEAMTFRYDPATRTATWTVAAHGGTIDLRLQGDAVHDEAGHALDGNQDGVDGGDFHRVIKVGPESK